MVFVIQSVGDALSGVLVRQQHVSRGTGQRPSQPVWPWHCCSEAPASARARLPGLGVVLPSLVICSDHSKDSTHGGPEQVKGCHFQGRLWHRWGQGQAKARLSELSALQCGCSPPSLATLCRGTGLKVLGQHNAVLSSLPGWQRVRQASCKKLN